MTAAAQILSHRTLYGHPDHYCAWPALVRAANGDLLLAFIHTQQHMYPSGHIVLMRSTDNGGTWTGPTVVYNTTIDDRECGLTVLPDGRVAMHIWSTFWKAGSFTSLPFDAYPPQLIANWVHMVEQPAYKAAAHLHGGWVIVSGDHGHTWSAPTRGPDSVHGGIALQNGTLLVAGYREDEGDVSIHLAAEPQGPWTKTAVIGNPSPDTHRIGEPHAVQLPGGRILVMLRYTAIKYDDRRPDLHLWGAYSDDNGLTWSRAFRTPLLGFPPHLTVLQDGRVLCTYGYRREPFGERAALSRDGITWDLAEEIVLRADNGNHDLGYPASLELSPGEILTVYYQKPAFDPADIHRHKPEIVATRWRVPPA
ncbi:MAG TPA: sialidase family protein [Opitutaceae bacterium]|nr:sialidase family protein [Opitutaceae bacterium]HRJ45779.1 sialidase family protein [Opitutaceae bacterium]